MPKKKTQSEMDSDLESEMEQVTEKSITKGKDIEGKSQSGIQLQKQARTRDGKFAKVGQTPLQGKKNSERTRRMDDVSSGGGLQGNFENQPPTEEIGVDNQDKEEDRYEEGKSNSENSEEDQEEDSESTESDSDHDNSSLS